MKFLQLQVESVYIQERKTEDGKTHFRVQIRLKGYPTTSATFERKTDAKLWIQQTESAMREGRHFKTSEAKKHTVADLIDRYIENLMPTKPKGASWLDDSPMRKITKPKEARGRIRFLNDIEREALLIACRESSNPFLYPAFVLSISTGMRQAEVMNLRWENIDLDKGRIVLHETKNGEIRVVPLQGFALQLLCNHFVSQSKNHQLA